MVKPKLLAPQLKQFKRARERLTRHRVRGSDPGGVTVRPTLPRFSRRRARLRRGRLPIAVGSSMWSWAGVRVDYAASVAMKVSRSALSQPDI
jgi:hypothetical protein